MMAALKVALSTSRSTGASVSPLIVARTAPEGKEKQRLALRKQVSFKDRSDSGAYHQGRVGGGPAREAEQRDGAFVLRHRSSYPSPAPPRAAEGVSGWRS